MRTAVAGRPSPEGGSTDVVSKYLQASSSGRAAVNQPAGEGAEYPRTAFSPGADAGAAGPGGGPGGGAPAPPPAARGGREPGEGDQPKRDREDPSARPRRPRTGLDDGRGGLRGLDGAHRLERGEPHQAPSASTAEAISARDAGSTGRAEHLPTGIGTRAEALTRSRVAR